MKMSCNIDKLAREGKGFDPFSSEGSKLLRKAGCKVIVHYSSDGVTAYVGDKISNSIFVANGYIHKIKKLSKWKAKGNEPTEWLNVTRLEQPLVVFGERNNVSLFPIAKIPSLTQSLEKIKFKMET